MPMGTSLTLAFAWRAYRMIWRPGAESEKHKIVFREKRLYRSQSRQFRVSIQVGIDGYHLYKNTT